MNVLKAILGLAGFAILSFSDEQVSVVVKLLVFSVCWGGVMLLTEMEKRQRQRKNAERPMVTIRAKVADRRSITRGTGKYKQRVYFLTFVLSVGDERKEFEVSEAEAKRYPIGEEGYLQYRGWQYLGFRRYLLDDAAEKQEKTADDGILLHELEE